MLPNNRLPLPIPDGPRLASRTSRPTPERIPWCIRCGGKVPAVYQDGKVSSVLDTHCEPCKLALRLKAKRDNALALMALAASWSRFGKVDIQGEEAPR